MLAPAKGETQSHIAYLVSDIRIPFWDILHAGIAAEADKQGYALHIHSAQNSRQKEIENAVKALQSGASGIVFSPIDSSSAVTILRLAERASVPVVIADIGADSGKYVSYIASDNLQGAEDLGNILVKAFRQRPAENPSVGIIAIPQKRENGRLRTQGFVSAIERAGYRSAGLRQQQDFSYQETYQFASELIQANPNLQALWLQGSDRYQAALDAIADANKQGEIALICFDAEPEFIDMLQQGTLLAAGMQQPFLMGEMAMATLHKHLQGETVAKHISLPVLAVSQDNLDTLRPRILRNVLGRDERL